MPSNVGPLTMPNYEALAAQGIYPWRTAGASSRASATRPSTSTSARRSTRSTSGAIRRSSTRTRTRTTRPTRSGSTRSPASTSTRSPSRSRSASSPNPNAVLGLYASTSRQKNLHRNDDGTSSGSGGWVQVARMANPLVNELIIPTDRKDRWNATRPQGRGPVPQLLPELEPRHRPEPPLRHLVPDDRAHRPGRHAPAVQRRRHVREEPTGAPSSCGSTSAYDPTAPGAQKRLGVLAGTPPASRTGGGRTTT